MATPMAEEQKNVATDPEERFIDNTVEPLDAMVDDDNSESGPISEVVGSAHKVLGYRNSWVIGMSSNFSYREKAAVQLLVRDAYRRHNGYMYEVCQEIRKEMGKEFGGTWNVFSGKPLYLNRRYYNSKYVEMTLGKTLDVWIGRN